MLIAATFEIIGDVGNLPESINFFTAISRAIYPPVIEAVLVPPSAWITSQSIIIDLSPNFCRLTLDLNALPINR